ncbi:MAG TPA: FAD synthetase family protein [Clostridiaceae bacterium]|nr:FAD synthetase family protein [Clostridiaceae bacterium]
MKVYLEQETWPEGPERGIALGTFDGVHLGHQALIAELLADAKRSGRVPSVFTFSDHPDLVFKDRDTFPGLIMTVDEKLNAFAALGVEEVFLLPLAPEIYRLSAEEFLQDLLRERLNTGFVVVGEDARFGSCRSGDVELLRAWGQENQVETSIIPDLYIDERKISSTGIRHLLKHGDLKQASKLLGRSFGFVTAVSEMRVVERSVGDPVSSGVGQLQLKVIELELAYPQEIVTLPPGQYQAKVYTKGSIDSDRTELMTIQADIMIENHCPLIKTYLSVETKFPFPEFYISFE